MSLGTISAQGVFEAAKSLAERFALAELPLTPPVLATATATIFGPGRHIVSLGKHILSGEPQRRDSSIRAFILTAGRIAIAAGGVALLSQYGMLPTTLLSKWAWCVMLPSYFLVSGPATLIATGSLLTAASLPLLKAAWVAKSITGALWGLGMFFVGRDLLNNYKRQLNFVGIDGLRTNGVVDELVLRPLSKQIYPFLDIARNFRLPFYV